MDQTTMVLLTGLLGTALGVVLIGGAMVGAFLIGRARGRRDALQSRSDHSPDPLAQLAELERGQRALRAEVALLSSQLRVGAPDNRPRERDGAV